MRIPADKLLVFTLPTSSAYDGKEESVNFDPLIWRER
jgi:hypothetical protein